jgi:serpin B
MRNARLVRAPSCLLAIFPLSLASVREISAQETGTVVVSVRDDLGKPFPGVMLMLLGRTHREGRTDERGLVRLERVPAGRVALSASTDYGWTYKAFTLSPGDTIRWDVILSKRLEREARVADSTNLANGRLDSVATGLVKADSSSVFAFRSFAQKFFLEVLRSTDPESSAVISPISAALALSMTYAGARGSTERAMARALGLGTMTPAALAERNRAFLESTRKRTDVTLDIANAMWVDTSVALSPEFARTLSDSYGANARRLKLGDSPEAVAEINSWADSATRGKIKRVLEKALPDTARLYLANAVYFLGKWLEPFKESATHDRDFTLASGKKSTMRAMQRGGSIAHRRMSGYEMIRLPYRTGKTAMYLLLPDTGTTIADVAAHLESDGWPPSLSAKDQKAVHLVMPRFRIDLGLDLGPVLKKLDMEVALDCDRSDFLGMVRPRGTDEDTLCIGAATQKVFVKVDEEGTEAAAVTGMAIVGITSSAPPPLEFIVDRPFVFIIRDGTSGADLFVGYIAEPSNERPVTLGRERADNATMRAMSRDGANP